MTLCEEWMLVKKLICEYNRNGYLENNERRKEKGKNGSELKKCVFKLQNGWEKGDYWSV